MHLLWEYPSGRDEKRKIKGLLRARLRFSDKVVNDQGLSLPFTQHVCAMATNFGGLASQTHDRISN